MLSPEITFHDLSIGRGKFLITEHLLSSSKWPFCPLRPQGIWPHLRSKCYMCLILIFCHRTSHECSVSDSHTCGVPICTYAIKFGYFLLLICPMSIWLLDQPKKPRKVKEISPPPNCCCEQDTEPYSHCPPLSCCSTKILGPLTWARRGNNSCPDFWISTCRGGWKQSGESPSPNPS